MKKMNQFTIFKIGTEMLTAKKDGKIKIKPLTLTDDEAVKYGIKVKIQQNQLTHIIMDYCGLANVASSFFTDKLVNVIVPPERGRTAEKEYRIIAENGFKLNGQKYVRLCSGSGQIRRNTITFIRKDLYEPIIQRLLCGLELEDFGDDFNTAKFNAYMGLAMSGCHLLPEYLTPRVCVIDDYEAIKPHFMVNHVTESEVDYVTLPEKDYILSEGESVEGYTIRHGINKQVTQEFYDEIPESPPLNSFDGQGLMSPEWSMRVAEYLGCNYIPAEMIIRSAWVKGLLVTIPFHDYFGQKGITKVTDAFGKVRKIEDIDVFLSKSQFKMAKIYKKKAESLGVNAWDFYMKSLKNNNLRFGVTRLSKKQDEDEKEVNYQYLQALDISNEQAEQLCKPTEDFLRSLNSGDYATVYNNLVMRSDSYSLDITDDDNYYCTGEIASEGKNKKLFQKIIEANPNFIKDSYVQKLILRECESKFRSAKLGKLLVNGNFQFCVSDPVAQLEWIMRNHGGGNNEVVGVIPAGSIYSQYWTNNNVDEVVLLRSPMIDRNELAKRQVINNDVDIYRYLNTGLIYSIHDLTALQQGGANL